jgi:hypothetical protein
MLTTEQKLRNLQVHLSESEKSIFFLDLSLAREAARSKNAAVFVSLSSVYCEVPQFMPGGSGVQQVNEDGAVLLNVGSDPDAIPMAASLTKMPRTAKGAMGAVGHDAILFRSQQGRVDLGMFASLKAVGPAFTLKPFAIWL